MAGEAVAIAWDAPASGPLRRMRIETAARGLASAVAEVVRGILQGVVAFLLARGTAAALERLPGLVAQLRSSKLGAGFARWVETNWKGLLENPKLRRLPGARTGGAGTGGGAARSEPPPPPPRRSTGLGSSGGDEPPPLPAAARESPPPPPDPLVESARALRADLKPKIDAALSKSADPPHDTSVFYSGTGARAAAEQAAVAEGRVTLEQLPAGKALDELKLGEKIRPGGLTPGDAIEPWDALSGKYASSASGEVNVFLNNPRPGSVFRRIEEPRLLDGLRSGRVTKIVYRDVTGAEQFTRVFDGARFVDIPPH